MRSFGVERSWDPVCSSFVLLCLQGIGPCFHAYRMAAGSYSHHIMDSMKKKNASGKGFSGGPSNDFHPRDTRIVLESVAVDRNYFYCYQNVGSASKKRNGYQVGSWHYSLRDKHYPKLKFLFFFNFKKLCLYFCCMCVYTSETPRLILHALKLCVNSIISYICSGTTCFSHSAVCQSHPQSHNHLVPFIFTAVRYSSIRVYCNLPLSIICCWTCKVFQFLILFCCINQLTAYLFSLFSVLFSYFFAILVVFSWIPDVMNLTWLDAR